MQKIIYLLKLLILHIIILVLVIYFTINWYGYYWESNPSSLILAILGLLLPPLIIFAIPIISAIWVNYDMKKREIGINPIVSRNWQVNIVLFLWFPSFIIYLFFRKFPRKIEVKN